MARVSYDSAARTPAELIEVGGRRSNVFRQMGICRLETYGVAAAGDDVLSFRAGACTERTPSARTDFRQIRKKPERQY
jgi:hypothetical protein